ncbi:MAG: hypothetical protein ABJA76_01760 [Mucilaginibacter sp.]
MRYKISIVAALVGCFMLCFTVFTDLSGKWTGEVKIPRGRKYPVTYIFKVKNNNLTGSLEDDIELMEINGGRAIGSDINFSTINQNGTVLVHTGKYYAGGDSISMNIFIDGKKLHTTLNRMPD